MDFATYAKRAREDAGLTQREAATRIGIDHTYLSKLENRQTAPPSLETLREMALAYNSSVVDMMLKGGKLPRVVVNYLCQHPGEVKTLLHKARGRETDMDMEEAIRSARGGDPAPGLQGYA